MSELNQAYEILSNEELRTRFDQGEDPNDPQSHAHGGGFHGNPFAGFGGFGQGGPIFFQQGGDGHHHGGFKFHFG
jgi:DnaJ family protein C protein 3